MSPVPELEQLVYQSWKTRKECNGGQSATFVHDAAAASSGVPASADFFRRRVPVVVEQGGLATKSARIFR